MQQTLSLDEIKSLLAGPLARVHEAYRRRLHSQVALMQEVNDYLAARSGKELRTLLVLLSACAVSGSEAAIGDSTVLHAAAVEMLHNASLIHDDVIDQAQQRRGVETISSVWSNHVAVLVGDYILSTSLLQVSYTHSDEIVRYLALLGQTLSDGEILQLANISNSELSEDVYYKVIERKTASLFESCAVLGCLSVGVEAELVEHARGFGQMLGMMFQIRDDIFDYYDSREIGKPTGNDMAEGKLTLPVIFALNSNPIQSMITLAKKVKAGTINADEIAVLVDYAKQSGGIEYAEHRMQNFYDKSMFFINEYITKNEIRNALVTYLHYVMKRHY